MEIDCIFLIKLRIDTCVDQNLCQEGSAESDRCALEALFSTTGGEQWSAKIGWMSAAPLWQWEGINVDAAGRISRLNLSGRKLIGN